MSAQIPHPRLDGTPAQGSERPESAGGATRNRMICIVSFDTNRARGSSRAFVDPFILQWPQQSLFQCKCVFDLSKLLFGFKKIDWFLG